MTTIRCNKKVTITDTIPNIVFLKGTVSHIEDSIAHKSEQLITAVARNELTVIASTKKEPSLIRKVIQDFQRPLSLVDTEEKYTDEKYTEPTHDLNSSIRELIDSIKVLTSKLDILQNVRSQSLEKHDIVKSKETIYIPQTFRTGDIKGTNLNVDEKSEKTSLLEAETNLKKLRGK